MNKEKIGVYKSVKIKYTDVDPSLPSNEYR